MKRKYNSEPAQRKRMRTSEQFPNSSLPENGFKRKSEPNEDEPVSKKSKSSDLRWNSLDTEDDPVYETRLKDAAKAEFESKYRQVRKLCDGGHGLVFEGYRKSDDLLVAIKHIPKHKVIWEDDEVSAEVTALLKLAASNSEESEGASSPISLLDWYDLGEELVLILERPVPAVNLLEYVRSKYVIQESELKIIITQLINAVIHLEGQRVFHRDIKLENILIETRSGVPVVRLIDFGLSCFLKHHSLYKMFHGTRERVPPEYLFSGTYRAGPTNVWQVGIVLYDMLHKYSGRFNTQKFLKREIKISSQLSDLCQDFLSTCFNIDPRYRPRLQDLLVHPWLQ